MKESFSKSDTKEAFELVQGLLRRGAAARGSSAAGPDPFEEAARGVARAWSAFESSDPALSLQHLQSARDRVEKRSESGEGNELCEQVLAAIGMVEHRVSNPIWRQHDLGAISDRSEASD